MTLLTADELIELMARHLARCADGEHIVAVRMPPQAWHEIARTLGENAWLLTHRADGGLNCAGAQIVMEERIPAGEVRLITERHVYAYPVEEANVRHSA